MALERSEAPGKASKEGRMISGELSSEVVEEESKGSIARRNSSGKLAMSSGERENEGSCRRGGITGEMYWDTYGGNLDINMHSLFLLL